MRKISCDKLSALQRLILVMLTEPGLAGRKRREFRAAVIALYWGGETRAHWISLYRALSRLEERALIRRYAGCWMLTDVPPALSGVDFAFYAWRRDQKMYISHYGLVGPGRLMLQALRRGEATTKTSASEREPPGVQEDWDFSML